MKCVHIPEADDLPTPRNISAKLSGVLYTNPPGDEKFSTEVIQEGQLILRGIGRLTIESLVACAILWSVPTRVHAGAPKADVDFLSHSAKDKAVVRVSSLSASKGGEGRGEVSKSPPGTEVAERRAEGVVR